jgi:hypothetical protein
MAVVGFGPPVVFYPPHLQRTACGVQCAALCGPYQFFHIWMVRSRFDSVFTKNPFRNMHMNFGVLLEVSETVCWRGQTPSGSDR